MSEKKEALSKFLLDIECLEEVNEFINQVNIFEVLKIVREEKRHSNMLAWLLNPNESHGLGDRVLRGLMQLIVKKGYDNVLRILLMDLDDCIVYRERLHTDILISSKRNKVVICIENKIDSIGTDYQLKKYQKTIEENYGDFNNKYYVYLSPNLDVSIENENWIFIEYTDILEIIEKARINQSLTKVADILISNYIHILRRSIVKDDKIREICEKIYSKHKTALDLIFEYRYDRVSELNAIFKGWVKELHEKGEVVLDCDKCTKKHIRFTDYKMDELFPKSKKFNKGWNNKNRYFYEVVINENMFTLKLVLNGENLTPNEESKMEKLKNLDLEEFKKDNRNEWQWWSLFSHNFYYEDLENEAILDKLKEKWGLLKNQAQLLYEKIHENNI